MPGASWFPGAELNYAEQALRWDDDRPAVEFRSEPGGRGPETISHRELRRRVAEVAPGCGAWASAGATGWRPTPPTSPRR